MYSPWRRKREIRLFKGCLESFALHCFPSKLFTSGNVDASLNFQERKDVMELGENYELPASGSAVSVFIKVSHNERKTSTRENKWLNALYWRYLSFDITYG